MYRILGFCLFRPQRRSIFCFSGTIRTEKRKKTPKRQKKRVPYSEHPLSIHVFVDANNTTVPYQTGLFCMYVCSSLYCYTRKSNILTSIYQQPKKQLHVLEVSCRSMTGWYPQSLPCVGRTGVYSRDRSAWFFALFFVTDCCA